MRADYKKNFTDRLQFLGVIGPFALVLTYLAVFLRGSLKGSYLFGVGVAALFICWKWRLKGLLLSLALLIVGYFSLFSFLGAGERLWQLGASLSLALGLWITHLGFEEIKSMFFDGQLESQSRLDNLIELDDQLKRAKRDWDLSEEQYLSQIADKDQMIQKLSKEIDLFEQSSQVVDKELRSLQQLNFKYLDQIEKSFQQISKLEVEQLKNADSLALVKQELALSETDRERQLKRELQDKETFIERLKMQLYDFEEKLDVQSQHESNLSEQAHHYAESFKRLEDLLREKTQEIYQLQNMLEVKEGSLNEYQFELEKSGKVLSEKEGELVNFKLQLEERDRKLNEVIKKNRDLEQELQAISLEFQALQTKAKNLELSKLELDQSHEALQNSLEQKMQLKGVEIEELNNELRQKKTQLHRMVERNNETDQTIFMYEKRVLSLEQQLQEKEKLDQAKLNELNEARFALYQTNLDKTRLKKTLTENEEKNAASVRPKHWVLQLQTILKQSSFRKVDFQHLPKDLSQEIVTLNQTKALYKQLREQFEDKNRILEEVREKLFKSETQLEKLKKQREDELAGDVQFENELQKNLFVKDEEIKTVEEEVLSLNNIIHGLLMEIEKAKN